MSNLNQLTNSIHQAKTAGTPSLQFIEFAFNFSINKNLIKFNITQNKKLYNLIINKSGKI